MSKTKNFYVWTVLLTSILIVTLAGCSVMTPTIAPILQSSTPAPPYVHYTPLETSNVHLEFDYPGSWFFSEEKIQGTDIISVGLGDPRLLSVPTRTANEPHGTPSDFGRVNILIQPVKPGQSLDILVEPHKQGYESASWITSINDYRFMIDGYAALAFEYQVEPVDDNGFTSLMFERDIFFIVKDQLYQITFLVAEKERGGDFEQGYEYFFNSLKIVP